MAHQLLKTVAGALKYDLSQLLQFMQSCKVFYFIFTCSLFGSCVILDSFKKLKAELNLAETTSATVTQKTKMLMNYHKTTSSLLDSFGINDLTITQERNRLHLLVNSKQESNTTVSHVLN